MKLSGYVTIVLMIGLIFVSVNLIMSDLGNHYGIETELSSEGYVYGTEVSTSMLLLQNSLETLGDEDKGWFAKLGAGITAIPYAVIASVSEVFKSQSYLSTVITNVGSALNISPDVINILTVLLLISVVFAVIAFLHRARA